MRLMKAVFVTSFARIGQVANHFQLGELPAPDPTRLKKDQVLVEVKAAGMSVEDLYVAQKSHAGGFSFLQIPQPTASHAAILGCDFAGRVQAVGPRVRKLQVGDTVCGLNDAPNLNQQGVWCEQVLTLEERVVKFDSQHLTFCDAAALVIPAFVATSMRNKAQIAERIQKRLASSHAADPMMILRCLVVGASGPIGSALTQLLCQSSEQEQMMIHVTGVCGPSNLERVLQLGAQQVLDYTQGSIALQLQTSAQKDTTHNDFDCIFDLVGGRDVQDEALSLLKPGGCFVTAVGLVCRIGSRLLTYWEQTLFFYHLFMWVPLYNLFADGHRSYHFVDPPNFSSDLFQPLIDAHVEAAIERVVPLNRQAIREAMELLQSGKHKGRILLALAPECESEQIQQTRPS